jgi:hypothetical protein
MFRFSFVPMKDFTVSLWALVALVACSKPQTSGTPPLAKQMTGAVTAPLGDLNLVHAKIPPVLLAAQRAPYAPPANPTCEGLTVEIRLLDAALGADLDAPARPDSPGLVERGRSEAGEAAVGAVRGAAEGLIPFRGWVRKLSGAERFSKQVTGAITAGLVRRAYLKGLGQAQGCPAPAAPVSGPKPPAAPDPPSPAKTPAP